MMLQELDRAVLLVDLSQQRLAAGDIGTVVNIHNDGGREYTEEHEAKGRER
jgi:Domain of unknown function (DUF4926)